MKDMKLQNLIGFTIIYGCLSIAVFLFLTMEGLSIWMGINVVLAMVPLVTIVYLYNRFLKNEMRVDWIVIVGLLFFIFFYPNSFYILTDFMHIDRTDFYITEMYQGTTYLRDISPYFMLGHIIISALIGAYAGIQSLLYLEKMITLKFGSRKLANVVSVIVLLLSSVGIYIGRFLRFFSWDVFRPIILLKEFFGSIDVFSVEFIITFTILELIIFYGYKHLLIGLPNKIKEI